ncbi:MAG: peptidase P60 [Alphaproteobacteria bacterium]|nr:peptidase P60 [Alphaproteobacteria bacterium]
MTVAVNRPLTADPAAVVALARGWLGTPYRHQASAKGAGADCLGLVRGVWRELYGAEPEAPPPYGPDWNERFAASEPLLSAARRHLAHRDGAPRPGDVLMFRIVRGGPVRHCGIMTDQDRFAHAYAGRAVIESWFNRWWTERLAEALSFPGDINGGAPWRN